MAISHDINNLVKGVKSTSEFVKFKEAYFNISKNPSLKDQLAQLNKKQVDLFSQKLSQKEIQYKKQQLDKEYSSLLKTAEVQNYLKAFNDFNQLMSKVYTAINESMEKEFK